MTGSEILDSRYSWVRLGVTLLIATVANVGMWAIIVIMPAMQAEFGTGRADASLPYTATMVGFALGNLLIGRAVDRYGITVSLIARHALHQRRVCAGSPGQLDCCPDSTSAFDWLWHSGWVRPSDRRYFALVSSSPWHRGGDCGQRELPIRGDLAIGPERDIERTRLADRLSFAGSDRPDRRCAAGLTPAKGCAGSGIRGRRDPGPPQSAHRRIYAPRTADASGRRRNRVLRGNVDAAGSYRRLLQRSGLRPRVGAEMLSLMLLGGVARGWSRA